MNYFDLEETLNNLFKAILDNINAMSKAKRVEEKVQYSQVVKNLSDSVGVFLNFATEVMSWDLDEINEIDEIDEDELEEEDLAGETH